MNFKLIKDIIVFILAVICLIGAIVMIDTNISAVFGYGIVSLILFFFSKDIILNQIWNIKKQEEIFEELKNDIETAENNLLEIDKEIAKRQEDLNYLKIEISKLNNTKTAILYSLNKTQKEIDKMSLEYVDQLSGLDFEQYISELLIKLNFKDVKVTPASGDFGIDIIAKKDNIKYAIQCKNYTSPLSNKCVQEAYSGKQYYNCHVAVVITNNYFTEHAKELAENNGVLLWDRDKLFEMINSAKKNTNSVINDTFNQTISNTFDSKNDELDEPLYKEVLEFAIQTGKISTSIIQRKFRLGYNRAAKIIDLLEKNGIVGPANGANPREVLTKVSI